MGVAAAARMMPGRAIPAISIYIGTSTAGVRISPPQQTGRRTPR
jgi:hypothetical protein